jgi:hypothetical protein
VGNKLRAETLLKVGGRTFALCFDWNAAVEFESAAGRPLSAAMIELAQQDMSATSLRAMLWAGLRRKHRRVSLAQAGSLIARVGRSEAMRVMGVALRYYYPEILDDGPPDPPAPGPAT